MEEDSNVAWTSHTIQKKGKPDERTVEGGGAVSFKCDGQRSHGSYSAGGAEPTGPTLIDKGACQMTNVRSFLSFLISAVVFSFMSLLMVGGTLPHFIVLRLWPTGI